MQADRGCDHGVTAQNAPAQRGSGGFRRGRDHPGVSRTTVVGMPEEEVPGAVQDMANVLARQVEADMEGRFPGIDAGVIIVVKNPIATIVSGIE